MNLLRTPGQADMNELLVNLEKSGSYYRDAADWIDHDRISPVLQEIAEARDELVKRLRGMVQSMGDLPDRADPEREEVAKLVKRLGAAVSDDQKARVIQQRLDEDRDLVRQVGELRTEQVPDDRDALLSELSSQIQSDGVRLQELLEAYG